MQVKIVFTIALALLGWSVAGAEEGCRAQFDRSMGQYTRLVDSLRLDKPGQAHVYTPNGLEFTPAEGLWLQGQLREVVTLARPLVHQMRCNAFKKFGGSSTRERGGSLSEYGNQVAATARRA